MTRKERLEKEKRELEADPDMHYLGNIWGWKFSYLGLGLIVFLLAFAIIRAKMLGVPFAPNPESTPIESAE